MTLSLFFQSLISGVLIGGVYAIIAVGLSLGFGLMRIINWAHGAFLMVSMYIAFMAVLKLGIDPYLSIIITAPVMFVIGYFLQKLIFNRILDKEKDREPLSILMFTAGLAIFLSSLVDIIFGSNLISAHTRYTSQTIRMSGLFISVPRLISFVIAMAVTAALYVIIQRTEFGRALRATAQNRQVAQLMGINYKNLYSIAFGLGLAMVGVAGSLLVPSASVTPSLGSSYGVKCFVIVVLGGMGSIPGALLGGLIVGLIESFGAILWTESYAQMLVFILFILMLLFKPTGLLGKEK